MAGEFDNEARVAATLAPLTASGLSGSARRIARPAYRATSVAMAPMLRKPASASRK